MPGFSTHSKNRQLYLQMKGVHSLLRVTLSVVEGMVALPIFYNRKSEYTSAETLNFETGEFPAVSFFFAGRRRDAQTVVYSEYVI